MNVTLERSTAEDLIQYKLRHVQKLIQRILHRWNENTVDSFLEKARDGTYSEAENDAIDVQNLVCEEQRLQKLLKNL